MAVPKAMAPLELLKSTAHLLKIVADKLPSGLVEVFPPERKTE